MLPLHRRYCVYLQDDKGIDYISIDITEIKRFVAPVLSLHGYTGMEEAAGAKVQGVYVRYVCYIGTSSKRGICSYAGDNTIKENNTEI